MTGRVSDGEVGVGRREAARSRVWRVSAVAALALVTGCTGSSDGGGVPSATSSAGIPVATATATAFPVPPSASPSPLPAIGTRSKGDWTFTLTAVRRAGSGQVMVEGTLTGTNGGFLAGFEEPGYALRKNTGTGKLDNTYEFSAVTLTVAGDSTVYQPMRDASGGCACTQGVLDVKAGQPYGVYTLMTAPQSASTVTVTVQGFGAFTNVPVGA
jgi:hypothetical protein